MENTRKQKGAGNPEARSEGMETGLPVEVRILIDEPGRNAREAAFLRQVFAYVPPPQK